MRRVLAPLGIVIVCAGLFGCGGAKSPLAPDAASTPSTGSIPTTTPSEPFPPAVRPLPGIWRGYLSAADCPAGYPCSGEVTTPFVLRIAEAAGGYVGALELESAADNSVVMDVTGIAQPDGAVLFTGNRGQLSSDQATIELRRLSVRSDSAAGLVGEIDLRRFYTNGGNNRTFIGRVLSASFQPIASAGQSVAGSWSGLAIVRGCSGYCPIFQNVGKNVRITLALGQSGGQLTGSVLLADSFCASCWQPVSGTASAGSFSLSGPLSGPTRDMRSLENFSGAVDVLGRITGTFRYYAEDFIAISPFNVSAHLDCEILWLKRD